MSLREELKQALNEYAGFPARNAPEWVDWEIALDEQIRIIDKYCWLKGDYEDGDVMDQLVKKVLDE